MKRKHEQTMQKFQKIQFATIRNYTWKKVTVFINTETTSKNEICT